MIASIMLYGLSISLLIGLGALAIERGFAARRWPRRGIWIIALALSLGLPALMTFGTLKRSTALTDNYSSTRLPPALVFTMGSESTTPILTTIADDTTMGSARRSTAPFQLQWPFLPKLDAPLKVIWIVSSLGLLAAYTIGWVLLRRTRRRWSRTTIEGELVFVSDTTGPAVFGFRNPIIVVPRWLFGASRATRQLVIAHEKSHIVARDPLCLQFGLLVMAVTPWNLILWWQLSRLRFAIEVDCDARVLLDNDDVAGYGEALISVGQRTPRIPAVAIALIEQKSRLERRILAMTRVAHRYTRLTATTSIAVCASMVVAAAQIDAPPLDRFSDMSSPHVVKPIANATANGRPSMSASINPAKAEKAVLPKTTTKKGSARVLHTFNLQDREVLTVLNELRTMSGQQMVISQSVRGTITLRLKDVSWEEALDAVLLAKGLAKRKQGKVMIIGTFAEISARDAAMLAWKKDVSELAPLQSEYMTLKYAEALNVAREVKANLLSGNGSISVDEQANTLILQDTPDQLTSIRQFVLALDVPPPATQPSSP